MAWLPGKQLQGGKYTIQKVIGHGRLGITYLARNDDGSPVVIKTPNDEALNSPDFERLQQVFVQEAFKLAQCRHSHIVRAEKPFREDGMWCIAMEYIDGVDLASRAQTILPEDEALPYIQQIGEALIEVHRQGLLHRDVRPANIMIRAGKPEAVLIDFGLAREFDHDLTVTRTEEISEGFAPPELYSRQAERGAYTDVYSLAATLYVLLTGKVPVSAKERQLSQIRLTAPKQHNPQIGNKINRAIVWGMEIKAKDRPQSMQEWLKSLGLKDEVPDPEPTQPSPTNPTRRLEIWQLVIAAIAAIGAIFAGLQGITALLEYWEKSKPTPTSSLLPTQTTKDEVREEFSFWKK